MKRWTKTKQRLPLIVSGILGAEGILLLDAVAAFCDRELPIAVFAMGWAALTLAVWRLSQNRRKQILTAAAVIPLAVILIFAAGYGCWYSFSTKAGYSDVDSGKAGIFADRTVLVVVPHQDDDYNILGGVLEEYVSYGSEVAVAFVTNGDYAFTAETRFGEAITTLGQIGIPESNVIFLGYGDGWKEGGPHIYNAQSGEVMESYAGNRATYGTAAHPAYRSGRDYTIDNLTEDLKSLILERRPDVIFCSDYDHHIDHKAVTLLFDKAMGQLLKENPDYRPVVYKAFAYGTAWEAEPDYYAPNILSTRNLFAEPYCQKPAVYRWEERVRLPVDGAGLSRSLVASRAYQTFDLYKTQGTGVMAAGAINGDRVFWRRETASLCLDAAITASSGKPERLNDFMLIENDNLVDESHLPYDGVWSPAAEDPEKMALVTLKQQSDLAQIVLYDHPSDKENVLNAVITFDNGVSLETGPLDPSGAGTVVSVDQKMVSSFTVQLTQTEGAAAGLTEIEALARQPAAEGAFLKLMDGEGNFLYDYRTETDGCEELALYLHGDLPPVSGDQYALQLEGDGGTAQIHDGKIRINCPVGAQLVLTVRCGDSDVSDTIVVRNPTAAQRLWTDLWQSVEQVFHTKYREKAIEHLTPVRLWDKVSYVLEHGL